MSTIFGTATRSKTLSCSSDVTCDNLTIGNVAVSGTSDLDIVGNVNVLAGNAYKIGSTSILSASTLGSSVTSSSLTSIGTLSSLNVSGSVVSNTQVVMEGAISQVPNNFSAFSNGNWVASESSYLSSSYYSFKAFQNGSAGWFSASSTYTANGTTYIGSKSTVANGVTYTGEYLQMWNSNIYRVTSIVLSNSDFGTCYIFGSDDLVTFSLIGSLVRSTSGDQTIPCTSSNYYKFTRILLANKYTSSSLSYIGIQACTINCALLTGGSLTSNGLNLGSGLTYNIGNSQVLSATTIGAGVTDSSLTSVGTLGSLTVSGTVTASGISCSGNISGTLTTGAQPNISTIGTTLGLNSNTYLNDRCRRDPSMSQ